MLPVTCALWPERRLWRHGEIPWRRSGDSRELDTDAARIELCHNCSGTVRGFDSSNHGPRRQAQRPCSAKRTDFGPTQPSHAAPTMVARITVGFMLGACDSVVPFMLRACGSVVASLPSVKCL